MAWRQLQLMHRPQMTVAGMAPLPQQQDRQWSQMRQMIGNPQQLCRAMAGQHLKVTQRDPKAVAEAMQCLCSMTGGSDRRCDMHRKLQVGLT